MLSISAVLPAYDEEEVIADSVAAMVATFESLGAEYEVIVVDDGSRDRTAAIVAGLGRANPRVRRRLNGWGWNTLVALLFGYTARDVDCAFKLFRRRILDRVDVRATGATFSAEFLIKARRFGYVIRERRASHYPRAAGQATGARPAVIARAFRELFRLRLNLESELARSARARQTAGPGV